MQAVFLRALADVCNMARGLFALGRHDQSRAFVFSKRGGPVPRSIEYDAFSDHAAGGSWRRVTWLRYFSNQ